jgi:hypothetical protein
MVLVRVCLYWINLSSINFDPRKIFYQSNVEKMDAECKHKALNKYKKCHDGKNKDPKPK